MGMAAASVKNLLGLCISLSEQLTWVVQQPQSATYLACALPLPVCSYRFVLPCTTLASLQAVVDTVDQFPD